ncbi:MAG: putative Sulfate-transporting ATPase [Frankiales bacterium]|nr:putative Sulfate-transporting ATPase [Frankiales bacterium]
MIDLIPTFLVAGLVIGSLYGLAGMGLVLTYSTSGLFNFAHGAVAAVGAFAFYSFHEQLDLPWPLAALLVLGVVAPVLGLVLERIAFGLAASRPAMKVVGTVGVLLFTVGALQLAYGVTPRQLQHFLPQDQAKVFGVYVSVEQGIDAGLALVLALGLAFLLRSTQTGRSMRAVVADPDLLSLTGQDPLRVRRLAWILGAQLAALSGVLIATTVGVDALVLTLLVVSAFGAAAVGRFRSLPLTFLGGLAVGVLAEETRNFAAAHTSFNSLPDAAPFLVLFLVLVLTPKGKLVDAAGRARVGVTARVMTRTQSVVIGAVLLAVGVSAPAWTGSRLVTWSQALAFVLIFASMGLLVWTSGQVSLCHAAFVAIGASSLSHLTGEAHLPWLVALLLAGLLVVPLGVVVALPAVRVSGLYLALATFGFGVLMKVLVYNRGFAFGKTGGVEIPRPGGFTGDTAYYYVELVVVAAGLALVGLVLRSRVGRLLRALADSPTALVTYGAEVNRLRVAVFGLSAMLAGVGGGLLGSVTLSVSSIGFDPFTSLTWLAVLALVGTRAGPVPAVAAAAVLVLAPAYLPSLSSAAFTMAFGGSALLAAVLADRAPGSGGPRTADRVAVPRTTRLRAEAPA